MVKKDEKFVYKSHTEELNTRIVRIYLPTVEDSAVFEDYKKILEEQHEGFMYVIEQANKIIEEGFELEKMEVSPRYTTGLSTPSIELFFFKRTKLSGN